MANVKIFTGTARSTRSQHIDDHLIAAPESTVLIVPTQRAANSRTRAIAASFPAQGLLGRPICTFQEFASGLLKNTPDDLPLVSRTSQYLLFKDAIRHVESEGSLEFLGDAAHSPGFLHHIQHIIAQLKQAAVEPESFRERVHNRNKPSQFDKVVADVYTNYQSTLLANETFDLQGMYWLAELACRYSEPESLKEISTVLIDGFDDFTPSEFRLIESIMQHVDHLAFGLNYDLRPQRRDAYALVADTHELIRSSFDCAEIDCQDDTPPPTTTNAQIVESLFWRNESDLQSINSNLQSDLTLMPCHTLRDEVEKVVRSIKRRIVEDEVLPADILIVHRDSDAYHRLLSETLLEAGVPISSTAPSSLADSAFVDLLLRICEMAGEGPREETLHVLTSPLFQTLSGSPDEHVASYRHIAYRAGIIEGEAQWKDKVHRMSERLLKRQDRESDRWLKHVPHLQSACESLLLDIARLADLTAVTPSSATWGDHLNAISAISDVFTLETVLESTQPIQQEFEFNAWHEYVAILHPLSATSDHVDHQYSRTEFIQELREVFSLSNVAEPNDKGGVLCLTPEDARHLEIPYVYCIGLGEGTLPSAPHVSAIYSTSDQDDLRSVGIQLDSARDHSNRERLLFLRLFSIATTHLTLSWTEMTRQGQVSYPSPFIKDVQDLHTSRCLPLTAPDNPESWPMNHREAVSACIETFRVGLPELADAVGRVEAKLDLEKQRYKAQPFNQFDGVLDDSPMLEDLANFYDTRHRFSANQIETYIDCPFRFMMNQVLEISPVDIPARGLDVMTLGSIYHGVLEKFYQRYRGLPLEEVDLNEALDVLRELVASEFAATTGGFQQAYKGLAGVELSRITEKLSRHIEAHHAEGSGGWLPQHFEVSFGEQTRDNSDSLSTSDSFMLDMDGVQYPFTGKIDRIDQTEDQSKARIVDYKSSIDRIRKGDILNGENIQLSLYAMVLENLLLKDSKCSTTQYLRIGSTKAVGSVEKNIAESKDVARESLKRSIRAIQSGIFHPKLHEKSCSYCPNNKVCRFEEGRIAGKTAP